MATLQKKYANLDHYADRHGKLRYYYRRRGHKRIPITAPFGTLEFEQEYADAVKAASNEPAPGASKTKRGTVNDLVTRYYGSGDFKTLQPATQALYRRHIEIFREGFADTQVHKIKRSHFRALKSEMWDRPGACRNMLKRLQTLFNFAVDEEMISVSPMVGVRPPPPGDGFLAWSDEDIDTYLAYWPTGSRERLGLYLLLYTGQRRSDVVEMGWHSVRDSTDHDGDPVREIEVVQQKSSKRFKAGKRLWIPLHKTLAAELELHSKDQQAFLIDRRTGRPLASAGFGNWIRDAAKAPKRPPIFKDEPDDERQLIQGTRGPHGLRKAACRRLIEAGCDGETARAISGHADDGELKTYIKTVSQRKKAQQAVKKWEAEDA